MPSAEIHDMNVIMLMAMTRKAEDVEGCQNWTILCLETGKAMLKLKKEQDHVHVHEHEHVMCMCMDVDVDGHHVNTAPQWTLGAV